MADLHVFTDGVDRVVARDPEDALALWRDFAGIAADDCHHTADEWAQCDDGEMLSIWCDADGDPTDREEPGGLRRLSLREWIERHGRGFLCSTEY